jgi:hypothetical protein
MPKKKNVITDEERRKRLRETARELETSNDPKDFESAFKKVVTPTRQSKSGSAS